MIPTPTQANTASGSKAVYLKGDSLASTESIEDFIDGFEDIFADAIEEVADEARREAREAAKANEQWRPYADLIDVEFKDSEFHYVLVGDEDRVNEAMQLEFGQAEAAPHSILRKTASSTETEHGQLLTNILVSEAIDA